MGTYQKIFQYQRRLLLFFYAFFCLLMIYPIVLLLQLMQIDNTALLILCPLVFIIICALAGSYLFVISYIPLKLVDAFDEVRNKIASEEITGVGEFADYINRFTVNFFNFRFFDVMHNAIFVKSKSRVFLSEHLTSDNISDIDSLWKIASSQEDIHPIGWVEMHGEKSFAMLIPIWFGKEYLGMMIMYLRQKPGKFFTGMIRDYEELFIDDQLLHIVNLNRKQLSEE
ncbi:MAG TPA: hypothetical protein PLZ52_10150 [Bacteroidales bacterium]|nr:hypothetical protein [Bacteroidales bacterium]HOE05569.1 hypothetical protein [Bacteroidales bacterium]HQL69926.1 hypothetical protein [Bacteroidales bacterium]